MVQLWPVMVLVLVVEVAVLVQTSYRNRTISPVTVMKIVLKARTVQLLLVMLLVLVVEVEVLVPEVPVRVALY